MPRAELQAAPGASGQKSPGMAPDKAWGTTGVSPTGVLPPVAPQACRAGHQPSKCAPTSYVKSGGMRKNKEEEEM